MALVDVGILNLTRYAAPDPDRVLLRPEGARAGGPRPLRLPDRRHAGIGRGDPLRRRRGRRRARRFPADPGAAGALFRIVALGPDGAASVTFPLPAFNGTGRVMVTAWNGDRVGQAQADVSSAIRSCSAPRLPRFLDAGDRSRLFVALDNVEGQAGEYTVDLSPTARSWSAPRRCARCCG